MEVNPTLSPVGAGCAAALLLADALLGDSPAAQVQVDENSRVLRRLVDAAVERLKERHMLHLVAEKIRAQRRGS